PLRDHLRQLLLELASHRGREARAMADEVELALVAVEPEQQRRDAPIALVAPAEANDHAIGGLVRLHLDDAVARAREVWQVRPLGDHAVEARLRQVFQPAPALLGVTRDRRERELLRLPLQLSPPPLQRQLVHGLALPDEQVERDVLRWDLRRELPDPALGRVQPELQRVEGELPVLLDDDLSVQGRLRRQARADLLELREVAQQRPRVTAPKPQAPAEVLEHAAKTVPLWLVLPAVAAGQLVHELGLHRREGEILRRHSGNKLAVGELDGVWNVKRVGGLLPPMVGVQK